MNSSWTIMNKSWTSSSQMDKSWTCHEQDVKISWTSPNKSRISNEQVLKKRKTLCTSPEEYMLASAVLQVVRECPPEPLVLSTKTLLRAVYKHHSHCGNLCRVATVTIVQFGLGLSWTLKWDSSTHHHQELFKGF